MGLITIGAFARASRLSPKALRLYDRLGLLTPARVDPVTGYRLYAPEQLEQARLVAWLRRLGMPLARIQRVSELDAGGAAREVGEFWARVEADTAERRELATFLVDHLSGEDPTMPAIPATTTSYATPLEIRYAALTDTGQLRESNQDTAYAGGRLLAVADGFGTRGGPAGAAAVEVLRGFASDEERLTGASPHAVGAGDLLNLLGEAVERAHQAVRGVAGEGGEGGEAGTTLTAMVWTGSQLALVHVGDSRAYLMRDGALFQITHDHTLVQSMIDEGRLTPEEATSHPQRSLLARALTAGAATGPGAAEPARAAEPATADTRLHDAAPGDRYLLCSDGLSGVVPTGTVRQLLATSRDPEHAVQALVALANENGGPDNVSCVVADVVEPVG